MLSNTIQQQQVWEHQFGAVKFIENLLTNHATSPVSGLVRMPTGTGKSGVISIICRCFSGINSSLVITPSVALSQQLKTDIESKFWNDIGLDITQLPTRRIILLNSALNRGKIISESEGHATTYVTTIQTLQSIQKQFPSQYQAIKQQISLIVFDEGHREPAVTWANAVRSLQKPLILFSATPYRNDFKAFSIFPNQVFTFTYQDAIKGNFIRRVIFERLHNITSPTVFIENIINYYSNYVSSANKPTGILMPKVIIRCENSNDIKNLVNILRSKNQSAVGIHENFNNRNSLYSSVRTCLNREQNTIFWVHQFKLVEGIDDDSFSILAIYNTFGSDRPLIQQIGRIIRNKNLYKNQKAIVIFYDNENIQKTWKNYIEYELKNETITEFSQNTLYEKYVEMHPAYEYIENKFRKRFNIKSKYAHLELKYKQSINAYIFNQNFSLSKLIKNIKYQWDENDFVIKNTIISHQDKTVILLYYTQENSPILYDDVFIELKLGFTFIRIIDDKLYYYDSNGITSDYIRQKCTLVKSEQLLALFQGIKSKISELTLLNGDLGTNAIRRRTISANSIEDTSPTLSDYYHFCSSATGLSESGIGNKIIRRYAGLSRSKISDHGKSLYYRDYLIWIDHIHSILQSQNAKPINLFERYAIPIPLITNTEAVHILIDIDSDVNFININTDNALKLDEVCYKVSNGVFTILANNEQYTSTISFDNKNNSYYITAKRFDDSFIQDISSINQKNVSIIKYINSNQSFRVIPREAGVVYSHSNFYKPRLKINGKSAVNNFNLSNIIYPVRAFSSLTCSEKGLISNASSTGWEQGCLFEIVDKLGINTELASHLINTELLICSDLGKEIADFISVDFSNKRVIFMHLKDGGKKKKNGTYSHQKLSASVFHEVCGQVTKNLHWLHPFSESNTYNASSWDDVWSNVTGLYRIRKAPSVQTAQYWWNQITSLIKDPSCTREVWILLSRGLQKTSFDSSFIATKPKPEFLQLIYILQSTWAAASSINADFKVFCSP